jgi:ribosomal protein S18 acetylase RimI-like enzyme
MPDWLSLEQAALAAWPALTTERYDGWVLRYARGYTRRANSITPSGVGLLPLEGKVAYCVARYRDEGLEPVFRIVDRGAALAVDAWLATRGWQERDPTLVLWRELGAAIAAAPPQAGVERLPLAEWISAYIAVTGDMREQSAHAEILRRIGARGARMAVLRDGEPVACALAVWSEPFVALVDLAVRPDCRRKGLGNALARQTLRWGQAQGAAGALLQVVAANAPARALYAGLGFEQVYSYWYRHPPD